MRTPDVAGALYREWIVANGAAECLGLGSTLALGRAVAPMLAARPGPAALLGTALAAILAGALFEGIVVGWLQGQVLQRHLAGLLRPAWVRATTLGAALAWLVGMLPSTVFGLAQLGRSGAPEAGGTSGGTEPSALLQYGLAVVLGAVTGPILGAVQARVLGRLKPPVRGWVLANAVAWALGMGVLFVGLDQLPWARGGLPLLVGVYAVCALVGAVVGAVHGRWLLPARRAGAPHAAAV